MTSPGPGLRERKKKATRDHIAAVATRLFAVQGFEATTIAQIAAAAEVAKMTVTNYFPLKEDLLFDRAPEIIAMLADAVTARAPGTAAQDAVRAEYRARLAARWPALAIVGPQFFGTVDASPALRTRERAMFAEQEDALAAVLVAEAGGDSDAAVAARIEAARLSGIVRVLYFEARRRTLAGEDTEHVVAAMDRAEARAFGAEPG
ncbi:TetR family transcriptional regulator [Actinomycetospora sp. NBRC 106375]|uniref:TetR/AcrR family transcriptional regulator n=1 Tax=Actinomycetospora sp. NBRC 106375 TaxID=3032207 RepID=UPI0024A27DF9|nr:TetR family transcriptional regulator [Actinomycetospora sp. NBRC 106375]GLZ48760.1 TetR family transcriptional regulator [Actinomycetospora sp. NBRC 106375]